MTDEILPTPETKLSRDYQGLATSPHGAVTSVETQATEAGISILEQGGNAVDAAVATAFALAVTHPSAGNLGGGGFLLVKMGSAVRAVDFREQSPASLDRARFERMIRDGGRGPASVGVPGTVAGLLMVHARFGKLPLARVLLPAETLARDGYRLGARQALVIGWAARDLSRSPSGSELFLSHGMPPRAGQKLKNLGLARAIRRIIDSGPAGFYEGPTANDIVQSLGAQGLLTHQDLLSYRARFRRPLRFDYRGYAVITMPPPSAGGVALAQSLLQLQAVRVHDHPADSVLRLHGIAEASRRAQVERRFFVVDPDVLTETQRSERARRWFDSSTWLAAHPIDWGRATPSASLHELYPEASKELEHTTHISVIDRLGNAVSCTVTLSASFGARVVTRETGIVLNNAVASFGSVGDNVAAPAQRTISSMAPTLLFAKGEGFLVLGSPGGDTIPSTLTQLILRLTTDGQGVKAATLAPRFHQAFVPDELGMESSHPLAPALVRGLAAIGHRVRVSRATQGDAHTAVFLDGTLAAYADPREGGSARAARESSAAAQ